jgi:hypothetical protein
MTARAVVAALLFLGAAAIGGERMRHVGRGLLCVTEGEVGEQPDRQLSVDAPKMRAFVNRWTTQTVAARFTYLGPTAQESRLASGATRRQFGLKLRAQDACNVVYAMWRFAPEEKLVVSVKSNPNQHSSAECGNRGYANIKPMHESPLPPVHKGEPHMLRAEMRGEEVRVFADGVVVWEGRAGPGALNLDGPVGMRSDNARLTIDFETGPLLRGPGDSQLACASSPEP